MQAMQNTAFIQHLPSTGRCPVTSWESGFQHTKLSIVFAWQDFGSGGSTRVVSVRILSD